MKGAEIVPPFDKGRLGGILRIHLFALVGATLCGRPTSEVGAAHCGRPAGVHGWTPLRNLYLSSLSLRPESVRVRVNLRNSKGLSVLFLIVALLLIMAVGYVLSYLIPTKQKSVKFPIYSTQAFYIAQSGMEYGVRYCSEQGWRGATDTGRLDYDRLNDSAVNQRNIILGKVNGKFTINYNTGTNVLTSTGEINNSTEKRIVAVSNFNQFMRLTFTSSPCWISGYSNQRAQFGIRRWRSTGVRLRYFSATWEQDGTARYITTIRFGTNTRFSGAYYSGSGIVSFSSGQSVGTGGVNVQIYWNAAMTNPRNLIITFYTVAGAAIGEGYTFNLDPAGNNLPGC